MNTETHICPRYLATVSRAAGNIRLWLYIIFKCYEKLTAKRGRSQVRARQINKLPRFDLKHEKNTSNNYNRCTRIEDKNIIA